MNPPQPICFLNSKTPFTFQRFVDGKVQPHVGCDATECGDNASIETPTPEPTLLSQDGAKRMADVPGEKRDDVIMTSSIKADHRESESVKID